MMSLPEKEASGASPIRLTWKQLMAAVIFLGAALYLSSIVPTIQIAWVTGILLLTIYLFSFEIVSVDVAAVTIMVILGLTSLLAPVMGLKIGLVDNRQLFDGFASNAVISIIAVMIIGTGLDKTGIMSKIAALILRIGGTKESSIIPITSGTVGVISSFLQNVGAAALFLPVVSRISARSGLPLSRLLMPMGFSAILGGTMTMVGSSPLILLNDLIMASNKALPIEHQMKSFGLFSVTPIGLALVATGVIYFIIAGRFVLPKTSNESSTSGVDPMQYFQDVYGVHYEMSELEVTDDSALVGQHFDDFESSYKVRVIASKRLGQANLIGPGAIDRDISIEKGMVLGVIADPRVLNTFIKKYDLKKRAQMHCFANDLAASKAGIAEVVIPPGSRLIGKPARDIRFRQTFGLAMIGLHRNGKTLREGENIRNLPFQAGDTLIVHAPWDVLPRIEKDKNFVVITTEYPHEESRPHKVKCAATFFAIAMALVLFTDIRLSVSLLTGAIGMILTGVLSIEEAYEAVSWKTVFLLASLIPLGVAVETSGTAKWIADQILYFVGDMPIWVIQISIATLATFFTLVMSNVGATVLLVPLAINIAVGAGANPAIFALTVAVATSNSFIIPTHQVNALIMGPAGYKVPDFMKAGGIMTVLFLIVMIVMMNLIY
jgi:di/tricarboxylate transporter